MNLTVALRLAYVVLTLSVIAVVAQLAAHLLKMPLSQPVANTLMVAGFLWPVALYIIAIYRRQLKTNADKG